MYPPYYPPQYAGYSGNAQDVSGIQIRVYSYKYKVFSGSGGIGSEYTMAACLSATTLELVTV